MPTAPTILRSRRLFPLAATIAAALLVPALARAQPAGLKVHKLTPAGQSFSDVVLESGREPMISPDGKWIAYWFDGTTNDLPDVYIASRFGGDVRRLSVPRPTGSLELQWLQLEFSHDSRQVLFLLDQETPGRRELWSVPVSGGPADAVKLSVQIAPSAIVASLELAGGYAVFGVLLADLSTELWTVPSDGSAFAQRLHAPLPAGAVGVTSRQSAGGRTVFIADLATAGKDELWSVPTDGSAPPVRLNGNLVAGGFVAAFSIAPDGQRVLYRASQETDGVEELYSVPITGPSAAAVHLSPPLPAFADVRNTFRYSSDGSRVLFLVDSATDEQFELWSVPIAGPSAAAVHLNVPLVADGDVKVFDTLGDRAVYLADNAVDDQDQAFIVPIGGPFSASVRLHENLPAGGDVFAAQLAEAPVGLVVAMAGDLRVDGQSEIFLQHLDGIGAPYPLLGDLDPGASYHGECGGGTLPDFSAIFACSDLSTVGKVELWRFELDFDSTPDRISSFAAIAASDVTAVRLSNDGRWVAFRADANVDERFDLFRVSSDGGFPVRVHATPASDQLDVLDQAIWFTPDSAGILYAADHEVNSQNDLWISDAMIFRADFEWGDSAEWSSVAP